MPLFSSTKYLFRKNSTKGQVAFALFELFFLAVILALVLGFFKNLSADESLGIGIMGGFSIAFEVLLVRLYISKFRR